LREENNNQQENTMKNNESKSDNPPFFYCGKAALSICGRRILFRQHVNSDVDDTMLVTLGDVLFMLGVPDTNHVDVFSRLPKGAVRFYLNEDKTGIDMWLDEENAIRLCDMIWSPFSERVKGLISTGMRETHEYMDALIAQAAASRSSRVLRQ
jgi:hypothetical protein